MPVLSNPRHEKFAQALAKGSSASEAYERAGYLPKRQNAARLMSNDDVRIRVAELQAKGASKAVVTLQTLLDEAEEARVLAMRINQPSAAVSAIKEKGVLAGLRVEKRENTNRTALNEMTDDELAAIASGRSEGVAEAPGGAKVTH